MGYQLSKVIQYFFSILFPILAYIIGGLANLEFSYHHYIQFNPYHIPSVFSLLTLFSLQSNIGAFRLHLFCFKNDLRIKMFSTINFLGKTFYFFVFDYISKNALKIILWYLMRSKIKLKKSFSFFILGKIKILLTFSKKKNTC